MQFIRAVAKSAFLGLLDRTRVFDLGRYFSRHALVVVTYHHVSRRSPAHADTRPKNTVFVDEFDAQLDYLSRWYSPVDGSLVRRFLAGESKLPERAVWVTFDDGYRDNYEVAYPLLQRHKLSAAFFVSTDFISNPESLLWLDVVDLALGTLSGDEFTEWVTGVKGLGPETRNRQTFRRLLKQTSRRNRERLIAALLARAPRPEQRAGCTSLQPMSWDQVAEMLAGGMTIGSHTVSHQVLAFADPAELEHEVNESRRVIEERTGTNCWCFAYPNGNTGDFGEREQEALERAGYVCAFTQKYGRIDSWESRFALSRVDVPCDTDIRALKLRVSGLYSLLRSERRRHAQGSE